MSTPPREPQQKKHLKIKNENTIEDATTVTEKAMKTVKPERINFCWRKLCPDVVHDFTGFMTETVKEMMTDCGYGKNG